MCAVPADIPRDKPVPIRHDWISKTLAGLLLGLTIALATSALFSEMTADIPLAVRGQLAMWIVPPIWLGIFSGVYFLPAACAPGCGWAAQTRWLMARWRRYA